MGTARFYGFVAESKNRLTEVRCADVDGRRCYTSRLHSKSACLLTPKLAAVHLTAADALRQYVRGLSLARHCHLLPCWPRTRPICSAARLEWHPTFPATLQAPDPRDRRLLFIGDSITAGFGVLCNDSDAPFTPETESAWHAYAAVASRALDSDAHVIAYSGKGNGVARGACSCGACAVPMKRAC